MNPQPPTTPTDQFIIKVKLLSNEVYEFPINPQTTKVSDLKNMILERISIPLDKQRIIFGAKQLLDESKVTDYVKESGMTVHLIARMGGEMASNTANSSNNMQQATTTTTTQPTSTNANTQQGTTQPNTTQQQQPNMNTNPFGNLLRGMGLGVPGPQGATMTFTNMNDLNSSLGGILGSLGIRLPQQPQQPGTGTQQPPQQPRPTTPTTNNPFQTPPTNSQRQSQQPIQPTTSFTTNPPVQQPSTSSQQQPFHISNEPILNLNQTISTLDIPSQPVLDNRHLSLREQLAQYIRRLQHQYMRMIPQLNRSVQLLNEGRVTHLGEVLRLLQAIDGANQHAEEAIRRVVNMTGNQGQQQGNQQQSNQQQQGQGQSYQQGQSQQQSQSLLSSSTHQHHPTAIVQSIQIDIQDNPISLPTDPLNLGDNVQATIIIQENPIDDSIDEEPTVLPNNMNSTTQEQQQQPQVIGGSINLNGLGGLLQGLTGQVGQQQGQQGQGQQQMPPMMGGLNINGLMSMLGGMGMNLQQQQPQQPQQFNRQAQQPSSQQSTQQSNQQQPHIHGPGCNHHHHPPPPTQQPSQVPPQQQQLPQIDLSNLANMASMFLNPQQAQQPQQSSSSSQSTQQQPPNPMGGLMGIFSSLQQSGGMGDLLNTSLGETLEQGLPEPTIYSTIFKSFTGSDILTCFTSKNFDFLDRKHELVRENFLRAISIAGSQEELVEQVTEDIAGLLIPRHNVTSYETCQEQVRAILQGHVSQVVRVTLNRGDVRYSQKLTSELKLAFCESITRVIASINPTTLAPNQSAAHLVFQNLKSNTIHIMDDFIQGLSGMFYGFIERDLIRVYNQYKEEQKRKQERSMEQEASEEELLKQIDAQSRKDVGYLKGFKHSQFYHPK